MSNWPLVTVDQLCELIVDCVNKTAPVVPYETPYRMVRTTNIRGGRINLDDCRFVDEVTYRKWTRRAELKYGDVLLTREAPIGEVGFVDAPNGLFLGQRIMQYRANEKMLNSRFLHYSFQSPALQHQFGAHEGSGSVVSHIRVGDCFKFKMPLPPLPVQSAIAELLGALDDKIELNRQTNAILEAMARALFKDWFVDFGPTRAKAEGRTPYLAPHLWELFPDALDDEDKPMGWKVQTLSDISSLNPDTWSAKKHPSQVNYVDLSNVKWGNIEATQRYVWADAPSRARRVLYPADTIVGTVRPGNGSYALIGEDGLTGSTGFAVLRPNGSNLRELVYCAATAPENIERLSHLADGAAYPAVRPDVVSATEFVRGNDDISSAFSELTAPLIDRLEANKQESRTLAQTRDLLLPKLMSGEIRLREAERIAEAVL